MTGQMSHASNPRARKKAREGERRMHAERQQSGQPPMAPEQARARLEEIAPWPGRDATQEEVARWLAVRALAGWARNLTPFADEVPAVLVHAWFAAARAMIALTAVPHIAKLTAREIAEAWNSDGDELGEGLRAALYGLDVDPDEVTRLEEVLAGGDGS